MGVSGIPGVCSRRFKRVAAGPQAIVAAPEELTIHASPESGVLGACRGVTAHAAVELSNVQRVTESGAVR